MRFGFNQAYLPCFRSPQPIPDRSSRRPEIGKGYFGKLYIQKVEEGLPAVLLAGLILILCIPISCNRGKPCNGISIWKIESSSDEGVKQIWLFVDQVLNPLLASLYPRTLLNARHGSLPNNIH